MSLRETTKYDRFSRTAAAEMALDIPTTRTVWAVPRAWWSENVPSVYVRWGFKRLIDIVVALSALLLILPVLPLIVLALIIQDGRSFLFKQARVGIDNSTFECLKFRSMALDADRRIEELLKTCSASRAEWEATQKLRADPRIHPVGRILRKSSLDEIPQLINVLRGDMSIVGPRPMLPEQMPMYGERIAAYSSVRPGITGLWQVSGRNTLSFQKRVELDASYSSNITFFGDMRILARTVVVVIMGHGSC